MAIMDRKLSPAAFGWDKEKLVDATRADKEARVFVMRIGGMATDTRPYLDKSTGEAREGLRGQFKGIGPDGEEIQSAVCYLPGYINEQVISILQVERTANPNAGVRFMYDIYAEYNADSATGYVFLAEDLGDKLRGGNAADEVFAELNSSIPALPGSTTKALEAPKKK